MQHPAPHRQNINALSRLVNKNAKKYEEETTETENGPQCGPYRSRNRGFQHSK
jgi:hypothetical protein